MKKNSVNLINYLIYELKIISVIPEDQKDKLGDFFLEGMDSSMHYNFAMLLGSLDLSDQENINEKTKQIMKKLKKLVVRNKNYFLSKINEMRNRKNINVRLEFLIELENNLKNLKKNINEMSKKNKTLTDYELAKLKKPRVNISSRQGPFKKDTKTHFLKKDPYDRRYAKNKIKNKTEIEETRVFGFNSVPVLNDKIIKKHDKLNESFNILQIDKFFNKLDEFFDYLENLLRSVDMETKRKIANKFLNLYIKILGGR